MRLDHPEDYTFLRFEKSRHKGKKYDAVLKNKKTQQEKRVPFGAIGFQQYEDRALGLYKNDDHHDETRRKRYRQRHMGEDKHKFSSGFFAIKYLW